MFYYIYVGLILKSCGILCLNSSYEPYCINNKRASSVWEHRSQAHLHLTLFCVYASMRTRIKRKKVLSSLQNLFLLVVRVNSTTMSTRSLDCCSLGWRLRTTWSCPASPRVVSRGVGKIQIPHAFWFFFASRKRTPFLFKKIFCKMVNISRTKHQKCISVHHFFLN